MIYPGALLVGLLMILMLLSAGGVGYGLAHAPARRRTLVAVCCGLSLAFGAAGTLLASAAYGRFAHPVLTSAHLGTPPTDQSSPPSGQSSPPSAAEQQMRPVTNAWLLFQSDAGDFIGAGKSGIWTLNESNFTIRGDSHDVQASVSGKRDYWQLEFRSPSNGRVQVGLFTNAERAPFVTGKAPGLDIYGSGRGCNTLGGQFRVKSVRWASTGVITEIDVVFEQHCELGTAALRGELWISTQVGSRKAPPDLNSPITV